MTIEPERKAQFPVLADLPVSNVARLKPFVRALDRVIKQALVSQRVTGAVVAVRQRGQLAYLRAAGMADREAGKAMNVTTPFRLASLTKLFTTAAALRLMDAGRLDPEWPVTDLIAGFRPLLQDGSSPVITVENLMSHTAGLDYGFQQSSDGAYAQAGVSDGLDRAGITLSENVARIASVALDRVPGTAWRYSVATDVLGAVIEQASGFELPEAIRVHVSEPLSLSTATFTSDAATLAVPYTDGSPRPQRMIGETRFALPDYAGGGTVKFDPARIADPTSFPSGGAGMAATAQDVLKLLEALRTGPFISANVRAAARRTRVGQEAQTQGPGWGYTWLGSVLVDKHAAGANLSQGSIAWGGVYGHSWALDFKQSLSILIMTNTAIEGMIGRFPRDCVRAIEQHLTKQPA